MREIAPGRMSRGRARTELDQVQQGSPLGPRRDGLHPRVRAADAAWPASFRVRVALNPRGSEG